MMKALTRVADDFGGPDVLLPVGLVQAGTLKGTIP
jgi:hypothetical protein